MRYIKKSQTPQFFIENTEGLIDWKQYRKKRVLKEYLLENEQNYLCGYCEAKVNLDTSHLEHIKPKSLDNNEFEIDSSQLDRDKSFYTLKLLQLNTFNNYLPEARKKALEEFQKSVKKHSKKTKKDKKEIARILLNRENLAFISFLRFKYRSIL